MSQIEELNKLLKVNKEKFFGLPQDVLEQLFNGIGLSDVNFYYDIFINNLSKCNPYVVESFYHVYGYPESVAKKAEEKGASKPLLKKKTKNNKRSKKLTSDLIGRIDQWKDNKGMIDTILTYCDVEGSWNIVKHDKNIVDTMDAELVSKLYTLSSPYNKLPLQNQDGKRLLFCITNLREAYMKRLVMTSLVSYIYRCANEYQFYDTDYGESKAIIKELGLIEPDKESCNMNRVEKQGPLHPGEAPEHKESTSQVPTQDRESEVSGVAQKIKYDEMKKMNLSVKKLITTFLNDQFEFNPDAHVASSYKPFKDKNGKLLDETKTPLPKDVHVPPYDTFKRWDLYEHANYDKLRDLTDNIYNEKSSSEYAIAPLKVVSNEREETEFREQYEGDITTGIHSANLWAWTYMDAREENRDKIRYTGKQMDFVNSMMEQHKTDEKNYKAMLDKRVTNMKKKDVKKHGEFNEKLGDYANKMGTEFKKLGIKKVDDEKVTDLNGVELDDSKDDCPEDAKEVNIFKFSSDVANEQTTVESGKFFVKASNDVDSINVEKND
jgi:hypothetical protein